MAETACAQDWRLISSVRIRSINGISAGMGAYDYNETSDYAIGPFFLANAGVSGAKLDFGYVGWSGVDGPKREGINPYWFPAFGLSLKASAAYKWNRHGEQSSYLVGRGQDRLYVGGSGTLTFLGSFEAGYYISTKKDHLFMISFGIGL